MSNNSYLSPTKNIYDFNIDFIYGLLFAKFKECEFEICKKFNQLQIIYSDRIVTDLFFNQDSYLLKTSNDEDKLYLEEMGKEYLLDGLIKFKKNYKKNSLVEMSSHSLGKWFDKRIEIEIYLHEYFGLYIFDEGIHPEYIPPTYKFKRNAIIYSKIF